MTKIIGQDTKGIEGHSHLSVRDQSSCQWVSYSIALRFTNEGNREMIWDIGV